MNALAPQTLIERVLDVRDPEASSDGLGEKILDASYEQFRLLGIRRSSMEDIARRAGVGRVTIYRRFESKERLVQALLLRECRNAIIAVDEAVARANGVEEKIVACFIAAMDVVRKHPLILGLLKTEPDTILPLLTVRASLGLGIGTTYVARMIREANQVLGLPNEDVDEVAEILARLVLSMILTPKTCLPVEDPEAAREFARRHVVPMVTRKPAI